MYRNLWFHDCCAAERSLAGSAAATGAHKILLTHTKLFSSLAPSPEPSSGSSFCHLQRPIKPSSQASAKPPKISRQTPLKAPSNTRESAEKSTPGSRGFFLYLSLEAANF
jgi:hypothetical protein